MEEQKFDYWLKKTGEVGYVEEVFRSVLFVSGLPGAKPLELVIFQGDGIGQVLSLGEGLVEVILLNSAASLKVGTRVARMGQFLEVEVGDFLIGKRINALGVVLGEVGVDNKPAAKATVGIERRSIDIVPLGIDQRKKADEVLETGTAMVDLMIPLAKGQREFIIGNRRTGKTEFLLQTVLDQATKGTICIYTAIAKRMPDIRKIEDFFIQTGISSKVIFLCSGASELSGAIFLTPYVAMTMAEYFRDQGRDVLIILDDMAAHARFYREISLLSRRFPGRNSYPGDIFYVHSRLIERAGNFLKGSISCLPVAEMVFGDLSGYIQTNLMSMTDGHLYFDSDLYNAGRRPAINPFLSVTRVGRQTQSMLYRDMGRRITSFLVHIKRLKQLMHFGAELNEQVKNELALGDKITNFFDQEEATIIAPNAGVLILALLWGGFWKEKDLATTKIEVGEVIRLYNKKDKFAVEIDRLIGEAKEFSDLIINIKETPLIARTLLALFKKEKTQ